MEKRSIAEELYSDTLKKMSQIELDSTLIAENSLVLDDGDGGDEWDDFDGDMEWKRRQQGFHTLGYRDGFLAGKEKSLQDGFNMGFKESVFVGQTWGHIRGVTSALACLPDVLKRKLVETDEKRNRLQVLHDSVGAITTTDALKIFYDGLDDRSSEQGQIAESSSNTGNGKSSEQGGVLQNHVQEFNMLIHDCSALSLSLNLCDTV